MERLIQLHEKIDKQEGESLHTLAELSCAKNVFIFRRKYFKTHFNYFQCFSL